MVVINPGGTFGLALQASETGSNRYILNILNDVAMAHVLPYESENATGRYICEGPVLHVADLVSLLKKLYPTYDISAKDADETVPRVPIYNSSTQKVRDHGLHFQPIEDIIHETVASFREDGLLH
ncbi:unnamed protein product [Sphagnum jensenii]|uniref:Cinnamoyl CoA reductase n=2 Tax=Sphagnum jensenii TaxID=128206 RepID=A0ABP0V8P4_9BRYO